VSRSLSRIQAVLLGLVVLAALALAGAGLHAVGTRQWLWSDTFHVQVGFRAIRGVEIGTRVRVQGVEAGEVVDVVLPPAPGRDVLLRLKLHGRFRPLVRADAVAQIVNESMVGGKVVEIHPGTDAADPVREDAVIASKSVPELAEVLGQVEGVLQEVRSGKGSLGKLLTDDQLHGALYQLAQQGKGTLAAIQQDADAIKEMPIIRNYVKDAHKLLVRPDCECNRQVFAEGELFEPGHSVLTAPGRQRLDQLVPWLAGLKHKGSEVVVASYAEPTLEPKWATTLTQKQSEAVCNYLKDQHGVQKMGVMSRRPVTPIGLGIAPPPVPAKDKLPLPRIEVIVFVPQG
jgi:phospholipid/cholesterol/gamma-HCH transport system substrate-binding protein